MNELTKNMSAETYPDRNVWGDEMNTFKLIEQWAEARNLIEGATSAAQSEKFFEECGELTRALIEGDKEKLKDAIGDCIVVLTILAKQNGMSVEDCINHAYNEIKDRTGRMVNGVFVKDEV